MDWLVRLYGWPHEGLHVIALRLIGRRPVRTRQTHVDIPDDLTAGQYAFVAGLPALVFWPPALLAVLGLLNAATWGQVALALAAILVFGLAAIGTIGDLYLILARLLHETDPTDGSGSGPEPDQDFDPKRDIERE